MSIFQRREVLQRIQVGLSGLAAVVLMVGLANIVIDTASDHSQATEAAGSANDAVDNQIDPLASANLAGAPPQEPLAELGVTPSATPDDSATTGTTTKPVVPDLEPDPALIRPMDRSN